MEGGVHEDSGLSARRSHKRRPSCGDGFSTTVRSGASRIPLAAAPSGARSPYVTIDLGRPMRWPHSLLLAARQDAHEAGRTYVDAAPACKSEKLSQLPVWPVAIRHRIGRATDSKEGSRGCLRTIPELVLGRVQLPGW